MMKMEDEEYPTSSNWSTGQFPRKYLQSSFNLNRKLCECASHPEFLRLSVLSSGFWDHQAGFLGFGISSWALLMFKGIILRCPCPSWGNYQHNLENLKAYQYSSATSVTLLDCWTIPWAMIFTWIVLGTRYSIRQFFGAALCVAGLASVFLSDAGMLPLTILLGGSRYHVGEPIASFFLFRIIFMGNIRNNYLNPLCSGSKPILGDTLVVAGTLFLAMSNVGEEFCVKKKDSVEVVAMIGAFGLLVSACEIYIMEFETLKSIKWSPDIILGLAGHVLSTFLFYTLVPFLLKLSGATMLSLSLLTSDLWAVVIRVYFYHQKVDWLYYLSFATITIGLIIYSKDEGSSNLSVFEDQNLNAQYQELNEGSAGCKNETSS
ncbi:hypothetical protein AAG906_036327 [Vitis piasezkii]